MRPLIFFVLLGSFTALSAQVLTKNFVPSPNDVPTNWKDTLIKKSKWQILEYGEVQNGKILNIDKPFENIQLRFTDTTIEQLPFFLKRDPKKWSQPEISQVRLKFFLDQKSFIGSFNWFENGGTIWNNFPFRVLYLKENILIIEQVAEHYFDRDAGKIFSAAEVNAKAEEADKKARENPWSASTGQISKPNFKPWEEEFRTYQVFKLIP